MNTFEKITTLLKKNQITYEHLQHGYVHRSKEAAQVRGSSFQEAAKALICQADKDFIMAVVPGPKLISYNLLKKCVGAKKLCLANPHDVKEKTGLTIGSIPPFGTLWQIPVYAEKSLLSQQYMVFSAGSHYDSIRLLVKDYLLVVPANVLSFCKE